jgi:hypothetical protein
MGLRPSAGLFVTYISRTRIGMITDSVHRATAALGAPQTRASGPGFAVANILLAGARAAYVRRVLK